MAVEGYLKDGKGTGRRVSVTTDDAIKVSPLNISVLDLTLDELTRRKFFTGFLKEPGGSAAMNVDGSVTPVDFHVNAVEGFVVFVRHIRFVFHDTLMDMGGGNAGRFASVTAGDLLNGLRLVVDQGGVETDLFIEPVKNMANFFQYSEDFSNIVGAFGAGVDFLSFDFNFQQPIPLSAPLTDSLFVRVQDNLTALSFFRAIATGVREFSG